MSRNARNNFTKMTDNATHLKHGLHIHPLGRCQYLVIIYKLKPLGIIDMHAQNKTLDKDTLIRMAVLLIGTSIIAAFSYFAYMMVDLLVDFFRTPQYIGLLDMVWTFFENQEGLFELTQADGQVVALQFPPSILAGLAILCVLLGLSSLGGLIASGLAAGTKMVMHAYIPSKGEYASGHGANSIHTSQVKGYTPPSEKSCP